MGGSACVGSQNSTVKYQSGLGMGKVVRSPRIAHLTVVDLSHAARRHIYPMSVAVTTNSMASMCRNFAPVVAHLRSPYLDGISGGSGVSQRRVAPRKLTGLANLSVGTT